MEGPVPYGEGSNPQDMESDSESGTSEPQKDITFSPGDAVTRSGEGGEFSTTTVFASKYSGPLPPAEQLERYEAILPGAADRIISTMEKETAHRHAKENKIIEGTLRAERLGSVFAFALVIAFLLLAAYGLRNGQPVVATIITGVPIGGIVVIFIKGRPFNKTLLSDSNETTP